MIPSPNRSKQVQRLRTFRKVHRLTGAALFTLFFVVSITGLLLGWKKHSGGMILPKSHSGTSTNLNDWLPIDSLHRRACAILHDSVSSSLSLELERIDLRPEKGMVKFVFIDHFWGIQLDGATGNLLHIERRRSDFIENIHDGSVLDYLFGTDGEPLKLIYTSVMGTALLTFTVTGFWLWLGPKRMRHKQNNSARQQQLGRTPNA
ncbi:MAG: PepSY domain-containing protein [Chlorobi bacterium CHB2]|nr:PepSY domain-containing protein [Chlorobi bacterium CHB2]